jgi:hypothetical protein
MSKHHRTEADGRASDLDDQNAPTTAEELVQQGQQGTDLAHVEHVTSTQDTESMVQQLLKSDDWAKMEREVEKFPSSSLHRTVVETSIANFKDFASSPKELPAASAAKLKISLTALYNNEPWAGSFRSIMQFVDNRLEPLQPVPGSRLSLQVGFMHPHPLRDDVFAAAKDVAGAAPGCDKRFLPLPTVVGTSGQGKTEVLLRLANNEDIGGVKAHDLLKDAMKAKDLAIEKVVPLFATFNQASTFTEKEKDSERALVSRLAAYWRGKQWGPVCVNVFPELALRDFLDHVRAAEAAENKCSPNKVLLLVLVDEVRRLDDVPSARRTVLNKITDAQSNSNRNSMPFLPVVSCLDLDSIYAIITKGSQRPIARIQVVLPTAVEAENLLKLVKADANFPPQLTKRKEILQLFSCLLPHFGSIHVAWNIFKRGEMPKSRIEGSRAAYELFGELLVAPSTYMREDREFDGKSLYDLAMDPTTGVIYRQTVPEYDKVNPMVLPAALLRIYSDGRQVEPIDTLMHDLVLNTLQEPGPGYEKNLERAIPMAEAIAAHFRVKHMKPSPTLRDLWGTADVMASRDVSLDGIKLSGPDLSVDGSYKFVRSDVEPTRTIATGDTKPKPTIATGDDLLKNAWDRQNGCHFYWPGVENYPAIDGVAAYHVCDRLFAAQMKTNATVNPAFIRRTLDDVQARAHKLGAPKDNTLHVLYLTQKLPSVIEPLPERCVVVGREGVRRLLEPFGAHTALLQGLFGE